MASVKESVERRQHKRFFVKNHAFTTISTKIGQINDISMGGLSFRYMDSQEWSREPVESATLFSDDFFLDNIPLLTVSDQLVERRTPSIITERRRSAKFGTLTPEQQAKLQRFINEQNKADL